MQLGATDLEPFFEWAATRAAGYTVKGDVFQPEKPLVWIAKLGGAEWDVDPSCNGVAVITPADAPGAPKAEHTFVLLLNFFDELRRRAP